VLGLDESEDLRPSYCLVIPVVDSYLSLSGVYSSSRGGVFEGFVGVVHSYVVL
jgi:hypothetical protein